MNPSLFYWFAALAYQAMVVQFPHPEQIQNRWLRLAISLLTRLSFLKLEVSPGTLHIPGFAQPAPRPPALYIGGELQPRPPMPPALLLLGLGLALSACVSLSKPRAAVGVAYATHGTLASQLNNFEADEGRRLLDAAPPTPQGKAIYDAQIAAVRKTCDFAKGLLAEELKSLDGIKATMDKPLPAPPAPGVRSTP